MTKLSSLHESNFEKFLIFDIFYNIIHYLDIEDIINLLISSRSVYIYRRYVKRHFINRILSYFYLDTMNESQVILHESNDTQDIISGILLKIYMHFKNNRHSSKVDFLIFMIEKKLDSLVLFKYFASKCSFVYVFNEASNTNTITNTITDVNDNSFLSKMSIDDIKYILVYCCIDQLNIIFEIINVPMTILYYTIGEIYNDPDIINKIEKVKLCINYIFYKHCFGDFNHQDYGYLHQIIMIFIYNNQTDMLNYTFQKKDVYMKTGEPLEYQYLINKCIDIQDKTNLDIIIDQHRMDNERLRLIGKTPVFVIINTHIIIKICRNGSFYYLKYIVDKLLGNQINNNLYIEDINKYK